MTSHRERDTFRRYATVALAWFWLILLLPAAITTNAHPQGKSTDPAKIDGEPVALAPGKLIERTLSGGETHSYGVQGEQGKFFHVVVEQFGIHLALFVYGPDRKPIASMENPNRTTGMQEISVVTVSNGTYTLELASTDETAPPGRYRVSVNQPRTPTPADRARVTAERIFEDAADFYSADGKNGSVLAARKFEDSLPFWRIAGETYEESVSLNMLGRIYLSLGERDKSLEFFNQALPLRQATGDRAGEAGIRNNIGTVYLANGETKKALDQFTATLAFERETGEQTLQAETLSHIGEVLIDLGQAEVALADFEQAVVLTKQLGDRRDLPSALNNIGKAYDDLGEKEDALNNYKQALSLERTLGDRDRESSTLSNIGMVYDDLGDRQAALDYYGQALKIERKLHALHEEATTRNNIASVYDELGQERKTLSSYDRALSLWRKLKDIAGEAMTLNNIGFAYHNLGQDQKALTYYSQALPILRGVDDRPAVAMVLHNIGVAEDRIGNRGVALNNLNESLLLFQEVQDPLNLGLTLGELMAHFRDTGNSNSAIFFGKEAVNSYQQVRRNITGLPDNLKKRFIASKQGVYRELADLLIIQERFGEAKQVLDLLKMEEYFEFIQRDGRESSSVTASISFNGDESGPGSEFEEGARSVTGMGLELARLYEISKPTTEEKQRMAELNANLKDATEKWHTFCSNLEQELNVSGRRPSHESNKDTVAGIQRELENFGNGTVALYTLVGEKKYRVILITSTAPPVAREYPIGEGDLRRKVFEFRQALQDRTKDPKPLAKDLYQILVQPIASELRSAQATTLMWSLDGALRYLPMSALYDGHDYLVAKYQSEVFSPSMMSDLSSRPDVTTFQGVGMGVSKAYGKFGSLPSVSEEIHRIIKEEGSSGDEGVVPGQTMLDETFTEDNMKQALRKKYPLVHIASHFDLEPGNEKNSFLLLGGPDKQGQQLSLAEIENNPEYNFRSIDLLTLSACETAMGGAGENGAEVDGLAMVAQRKGARAIVASLWAVDDKSTALLMEEFYRRWITDLGGPKAEALRQAQLAMMRGEFDSHGKAGNGPMSTTGEGPQPASERGVHRIVPASATDYSHPYYWAPFILMGNWQ